MELPRQLTPFIGRKEELGEIAALLSETDCRLLTIVGAGGIGKTRLALQVATNLTERFSDGIHFVSLQAITSSQYLASKLADALELPLSGQTPPTEQLFTYLQDKRQMLVLDNFEHLLEEVGLLSDLLHAAPGVTLLVTSREVLSLQEEWVYRLQGLKTPTADDKDMEEDSDAVQFFIERVRRVNPRFSMEIEGRAVVHICQLVEGIPLALELAASWAGAMNCEAIAAEIQENSGFLASSLRNIPDRHRSMRVVFDQSWNRLSAEEQQAFKQLSVFRQPFQRQAAEKIAAATLPILSSLVNKSLLQWDAGGRYHLHELLRQFAHEQLMASPEGANIHDRHCAYFADFLRHRLDAIHAGRQVPAMQEIEAELDNLRAAWHWAATHALVDHIRHSLHALVWFWQYQSRYQEAADALRIAVHTLKNGKLAGEEGVALAEVLVQYGWLCIRLGRLDQASEVLEEAQTLYDQLVVAPIQDGGSDPASAIAMVTVLRGDFDHAICLLDKARALQKARDDQRNLATSYYVLTAALLAQGNYQAAEESARRSYQLNQTMNERWSLAYTLNDLGQIAYRLGRYEEARQHYRASYAIRRQYRDREGMAVALRHLGQIALREMDTGEAARLYQESRSLYEGIGDRGGLAATLNGSNGVLPNGEPEFPEKVIGKWICRGWFIGDGAHATTGAMGFTTQFFEFDEAYGNATIVTEGYEVVDVNQPFARAITGGTAQYRAAQGEAIQELLGFNEQMAVNLRFELRVSR